MSINKFLDKLSNGCSAIFTKKPSLSTMDLVANTPVWVIRLSQLLFALVALGVSGASISSFNSLSCDTPTKLSWNVGCAAITLPFVLYLVLASGPYRLKSLPWNQYGQIIFDAVFLIFWISVAATSSFSCRDICSSCLAAGQVITSKTHSPFFIVTAGEQTCKCSPGQAHAPRRSLQRRVVSSVSNSAPKSSAPKSGSASRPPSAAAPGPKNPPLPKPRQMTGAATTGARRGMDAIMVVLFAASLALTAYLIYLHWKQAKRHGIVEATSEDATKSSDMTKKTADVEARNVGLHREPNPFTDFHAVGPTRDERDQDDDPFADTNSDVVSVLGEDERRASIPEPPSAIPAL